MPRTWYIPILYIYSHRLNNHMDFLYVATLNCLDRVTTEICWYFHYSCCSKHLTSHACALLIDNVGNYLYMYLNNGSFKSEVDPHQFNLRERKKIFTRGQFWPSGIVVASVCLSVCLCVRQSLACPRDNLSPVQARITKFGPEEQNTLVKIPIVLGVNWPWTSRSNLT